jgi:hypothetical protein
VADLAPPFSTDGITDDIDVIIDVAETMTDARDRAFVSDLLRRAQRKLREQQAAILALQVAARLVVQFHGTDDNAIAALAALLPPPPLPPALAVMAKGAAAYVDRIAVEALRAATPLVDVVAELEAMRESNKRAGANVIRTAVPPPRPCHTCGKPDCTPQNHAGWNPDDEGHG